MLNLDYLIGWLPNHKEYAIFTPYPQQEVAMCFGRKGCIVALALEGQHHRFDNMIDALPKPVREIIRVETRTELRLKLIERTDITYVGLDNMLTVRANAIQILNGGW